MTTVSIPCDECHRLVDGWWSHGGRNLCRWCLSDVLSFDAALSKSVLDEAKRLVHGDRQADYDTPTSNFRRMGTLWGVVLEKWKADPEARDVPPELVALCLLQLKVSREVGKSKRDNRVDMAGYVECLDLVVTEGDG